MLMSNFTSSECVTRQLMHFIVGDNKCSTVYKIDCIGAFQIIFKNLLAYPGTKHYES